MDDIKIVYKKVYSPVKCERPNGKPYGIRYKKGFILFFPDVKYYEGEEDRFVQELKELHDIANYLKECLCQRKEG